MVSLCPSLLPLEVMDVCLSQRSCLARFNLRIRIMYVKQEMYYEDGDILESILMHKNMSEQGHVWG